MLLKNMLFMIVFILFLLVVYTYKNIIFKNKTNVLGVNSGFEKNQSLILVSLLNDCSIIVPI